MMNGRTFLKGVTFIMLYPSLHCLIPGRVPNDLQTELHGVRLQQLARKTMKNDKPPMISRV